MKYYSIRFFLLFFFVLFLCKISYAKTFEANYKIEFGGIGIGKLKWVLNIENNKYDTKILEDGWTAVTKDKSLSAQFEHTIGITENGYEIFTKSAKGYSKPPYL